ncbi:MAG: hypothetical protein FWC77_04160 [Defluviitaleaceae bacterium]|nr:hypothetical protein [Defluviitaleaceae bacterium]
MHPISPQWRQNQGRPVTTEGFVELTFYFTDPNLQVYNIHPNNELTPVSQSPIVVNQHTKPVAPFATLEPDLWLLDASRITVPETFPEIRPFGGFISNVLCNDSGIFSTPVHLDIILNAPAVILPGVTIAWGTAFDEYPVDFSVIMLDEDGNETGRESVTGNSSIITQVDFVMRRVRKIRLEISRWCRGSRRARVGNIFLGHVRAYTKDSILAFASSHEIDPVSGRLPKYEISFELDNRNGDWDPLDDNSVHRFVLERQEVTARYGFRRLTDSTVEWIPGGQYFLTDWAAPRNGLSASFKARDLLGSLNGIYYKGVYQGVEEITIPFTDNNLMREGGYINEGPRMIMLGITLYELAEKVLLDAMPPHLGSGDKKWEIHNSLKAITTISPLPLATHAECLQLIANAAGAALTFDRDGILHIAPLAAFNGNNTSHTLNADNTYTRPETDVQRPLKSVQVSTYKWLPNERIDTVLYDQELLLSMGKNEFFVEYSDSAVDVILKSPITLMQRPENSYELFARSARLVIHRRVGDPERCHVVIVGRAIRPDESSIVIMDNENINNDRSDRGEILPLKNILITDEGRARAVASGLLARYKHRKNVSVDWRIDPSLNMGDFIVLEGEQPRIIMQNLSTDFRFSGAFIGKSEGTVIA